MKLFASKKVLPLFLSTLIVLTILSFFASILVFENKPQKAYAASKYWKGGFAGHTTDWNYSENWSATDGGGGGAGVPGVGDTVFFTSSITYNCTLTISPTVASITNSSYNGDLSLSGFTLTVNGNFLWNAGDIKATGGNMIVSGNYDTWLGDYSLAWSTNTLTLTGTGKYFKTTWSIFSSVIIDGTITNISPSPHNTATANLTVNAGKSLTINPGIAFNVSSSLSLSGTIDGAGTLNFSSTSCDNLTASGTLDVALVFAGTCTLNRWTFTKPVTIYHVLNLGTASGQTYDFQAGLTMSPGDSSWIASIDASTWNPDVNITGNLYPYLVVGGGSCALKMGNGTWNIAGDFEGNCGVNITAGSSTLIMQGFNKKIRIRNASGITIPTFYNLTINNDTAFRAYGTSGTVSAGLIISHDLTVASGKHFNLMGPDLRLNSGATTHLNGEIDTGPSFAEFVDSAYGGISGSGTITGAIRLTASAGDISVPAKSYPAKVNLYNGGAADHVFTFGTSAGQSLTFNDGLEVTAAGTGGLTVDAEAYNPNVTVNGNLGFEKTGGNGTKTLNMGSGEWTINGRFDATNGTVISNQTNITMGDPSGGYWSPLGHSDAGLVFSSDSFAKTMAEYQGDLYVAGDLNNIDGIATTRVAKWDGYSWTSVSGGFNDQIEALYVFNNELYAGGWFTQVNGSSCNALAKWNGSIWTCAAADLDEWDGVKTITSFGGNLIIGGEFYGYSDFALMWNGAAWVSMGTALDDDVYVFAEYNSELYAGGANSGGLSKWNGSEWLEVGGGANNVRALKVFDGKLIVAGRFIQVGSPAQTAYYAASWDGSVWSPMSLASSQTSNCWSDFTNGSYNYTIDNGATLEVYNNELYVGGALCPQDGSLVTNAGKWNGSTWVPLDNQAELWSVTNMVVYNNDLIIASLGHQYQGFNSTIFRYATRPMFKNSSPVHDFTVTSSLEALEFEDSLTLTGAFTDTTPDSGLVFRSGSTYTFPIIDIAGTSGHPIVMEGTSSSAWNLDVAAASPTVSYVDVTYSDASGGSEILANDGTNTDSDNNVHWLFGGIPPVVVDHIIVSPSSATVVASGTQTFTAVAYDAGNTPIPGTVFTWSTVAGGGSVDSSGVFTAGATSGTYANTVRATSGAVSGYATAVVSAVSPPIFPPTPPGGGIGGGTDDSIENIIVNSTVDGTVPSVAQTDSDTGATTVVDDTNDNTNQDIGVKIEDVWETLKESNPNLINIILSIVAVVLAANGLINAFGGFFSAEVSLKQYFLAFFNSLFVVGGKRKKIGFVYDSASGKKVHGAMVSLFEGESVKLKDTALTDKAGHYLFSVDKGVYVLSAKKSGYLFPSHYRIEVSDNYYGQPLSINNDSNVIKETIPIDPVTYAIRKESVYFKMYSQIFLSVLIRWVILIAGSLIAVFALIINPISINFVLLSCYIFLYVLEFILQHKEASYCRVINAKTRQPVDLALVRIFSSEGKLSQTYVTDRQGRVAPYTEERNCTLAVERSGFKKAEQYHLNPGAIVSKKIYLQPEN